MDCRIGSPDAATNASQCWTSICILHRQGKYMQDYRAGSSNARVKDPPQPPPTWAVRLKMLLQIAKGLHYLDSVVEEKRVPYFPVSTIFLYAPEMFEELFAIKVLALFFLFLCHCFVFFVSDSFSKRTANLSKHRIQRRLFAHCLSFL